MDQFNIKLTDLLKILASSLTVDQAEIKKDTSANDLKQWDSLGTINIITSLESDIGVKVDILEIPLLISVNSIIELLKTKGYSVIDDNSI